MNKHALLPALLMSLSLLSGCAPLVVGGAVVGGTVVGGVVEVVVGGGVRGSSTVTVSERPAAGATTQPGSATPHPGDASTSSQQ